MAMRIVLTLALVLATASALPVKQVEENQDAVTDGFGMFV